ncbi:MAG: LacI family DNA-binding transcriptional regulator [Clostridia bacterium]|nr:LacI family DNA-binding transcriptional regulator [Clostridia bacterium]
MTNNKVTMEDIAREMNVNKSTVSIAIADKYGVSEEMRGKIILKAIEMGYDFSQSKVSTSKRNKIAVIVEDKASTFNNGFWYEVIQGIEQRIRELKYQLKMYILSQ